MDRIEEVKKAVKGIMASCGVTFPRREDESPALGMMAGEYINRWSQQIDQLYLKADEEGLLTGEDALRAMYPHSYHMSPFDMKLSLPEKRLREAQRDLTSRLKDAEWQVKELNWASQILQLLRKIGVANYDTSPTIADIALALEEAIVSDWNPQKECQKRVEEVFAALDQFTHDCVDDEDWFALYYDLKAKHLKEGV